MKKIFTGAILGLVIALFFSFKTIYDLKKSTADVEQINGIYIFGFSKPETEYKVIGKIKPGFIEDRYFKVAEQMTTKAKKTYPTAQGLIIKIEPATYKIYADVIEFK